ncbi:hypothetical protein EWM64_g9222 [Hericium alpestre]|uniref:Uncharacterized protein n=1 Tax=Hericium alpestre TaxID=135208 RepID=A0A4Y9ZLU4_9AGAM|nr:hypothetical protein EWM64_g9222 [Hericium alpestre]
MTQIVWVIFIITFTFALASIALPIFLFARYSAQEEQKAKKTRAERTAGMGKPRLARDLAAERTTKSMADAWAAYVRRWEVLDKEEGRLTFGTVPWPVLDTPRSAADITHEAVAKFVLSPEHSGELSERDRVKKALLRWHPDRFGRFLGRVDGADRMRVEAGVGVVARLLNELLEKA